MVAILRGRKTHVLHSFSIIRGEEDFVDMDIKNISNDDLISKLISFVSSERETTSEIVRYLMEVDCRELYDDCGSLYKFCTEKLGYSEGSAYRRIAAARMAKGC